MTKSMKLGFTTASLLIAALAASAEVDLSKLPPAATKKGVTYEKDIKPLFEASCVKCHSGERAKGDLHLDTLEGVLKGSHDGKVITVGKGDKSSLLIAVSHLDPEMAMPPKPKPGRGGPGGAPPGGGQGGGQGGARPPGPGGPGGPSGWGPPPKPLTPEQVGLVRAWIDQGAK
jgi:hypothetical protein